MTEIVTGSLSNDFSKFVDEFSGLASQADTVKTLLLNEFKFEREHWIVRQNGTAVATVAVCLSQVLQKTAYVGFYENKAVSDRELICKILFKNVYNWCHIKSVEKIHGPINYSTWFSYRYCLQEYAETFSWEPENSTEYLNDFRAEGFSDSENYFSVAFTGLKKVSEMTAATYAQIEQKYGVYCREFDLKKN